MNKLQGERDAKIAQYMAKLMRPASPSRSAFKLQSSTTLCPPPMSLWIAMNSARSAGPCISPNVGRRRRI
eukprot:UN13622